MAQNCPVSGLSVSDVFFCLRVVFLLATCETWSKCTMSDRATGNAFVIRFFGYNNNTCSKVEQSQHNIMRKMLEAVSVMESMRDTTLFVPIERNGVSVAVYARGISCFVSIACDSEAKEPISNMSYFTDSLQSTTRRSLRFGFAIARAQFSRFYCSLD